MKFAHSPSDDALALAGIERLEQVAQHEHLAQLGIVAERGLYHAPQRVEPRCAVCGRELGLVRGVKS